MPNKINSILKQLVIGVQEILGSRAKKIILYGSYARGDYNKSSDIDIIILTDLSDEEIENYRDKICDFVYDIELESNIIISPLIKNEEKYNERINIIPFYMNIQKEGIVIHG